MTGHVTALADIFICILLPFIVGDNTIRGHSVVGHFYRLALFLARSVQSFLDISVRWTSTAAAPRPTREARASLTVHNLLSLRIVYVCMYVCVRLVP